jgi:hypothetical protein
MLRLFNYASSNAEVVSAGWNGIASERWVAKDLEGEVMPYSRLWLGFHLKGLRDTNKPQGGWWPDWGSSRVRSDYKSRSLPLRTAAGYSCDKNNIFITLSERKKT